MEFFYSLPFGRRLHITGRLRSSILLLSSIFAHVFFWLYIFIHHGTHLFCSGGLPIIDTLLIGRLHACLPFSGLQPPPPRSPPQSTYGDCNAGSGRVFWFSIANPALGHDMMVFPRSQALRCADFSFLPSLSQKHACIFGAGRTGAGTGLRLRLRLRGWMAHARTYGVGGEGWLQFVSRLFLDACRSVSWVHGVEIGDCWARVPLVGLGRPTLLRWARRGEARDVT
jgi:hypothetical protein